MHAMNVFNSHQYCSVESEIRIVRSVFPPQRNVVSLNMVGGQEMRRSEVPEENYWDWTRIKLEVVMGDTGTGGGGGESVWWPQFL